MNTWRPFGLILVAFALAACGSRAMNDEAKAPGGGAAEGEFAAFDQAPPAAVPGLDAAYAIQDRSEAAFVAFYSGGRYFAGGVKQLSAQRFQMTGVVGRYEMSGTTVVPHAVKTSCPRPRGQGTIRRLDTPDELVLDDGQRTYVLPRLAVGGDAPQNGYVIEWGCFDAAMNFTAHAWEAVK